MSDIALTSDMDLDLAGHRLNLATAEDAVEQQIRIRLRFLEGSWFLDERLGIPYFRAIMIKAPDLAVVRSLYRQAILSTPRIRALNDLTLALDSKTRELTVSFVATMDTGQPIVSQPFVVEI